MTAVRSVRRWLGDYASDRGGAAAIEFAIWCLVLVPAFVSMMDVGTYAFDETQVTNAAQAGSQAAWAAAKGSACSFSSSSGTSKCSGLSTAVTNAIANSSALGGSVAENTAGETQGYYCANVGTGVLTSNGSSITCPSGATAGYYYKVEVKFTYSPVFKGASVTSFLTNSMVKDAWTRLQ